MDPIEAYLKRTGYWLPREKRQSILAELRGVLLERVDVAAERHGRPLTADEMASLARDFGHPALVAAGYVEGASVISGKLAYFFWRVLWMALATTLAVQAIVLVVELSAAAEPGAVIGHAVRRTLEALLLGFACVTASFMIIERWGGRSGGRRDDSHAQGGMNA